jgi:hypothetical protein
MEVEDEIALITRMTESLQDLSANEVNVRVLSHTNVPIDGPYVRFHDELVAATKTFYDQVLGGQTASDSCRTIDTDERLLKRVSLPMT